MKKFSLLLFAFFLLLACNVERNSPEKQVENFLALMASQQYQEAAQFIVDQDTSKFLLINTFWENLPDSIQKSLPAIYEIPIIIGSEISENTALVFTQKTENSQKNEKVDTFNLVNQSNMWKIQLF